MPQLCSLASFGRPVVGIINRAFSCAVVGAMLNDGMFPGCAEACPADPTTTEAAATTEAAETTAAGCPRNCGTPDNGGGTCRPTGVCLSCNDNRLRVNGRCVQSVACRARRIQSGSMTDQNCRCLDAHCHYCNRAVSGDVCRVVSVSLATRQPTLHRISSWFCPRPQLWQHMMVLLRTTNPDAQLVENVRCADPT